MDIYLQPTSFIDSNHPDIIAFAHKTTEGCTTDIAKAVALYKVVRDDILYDVYHVDLRPEAISASITLRKKSGYCIEKALVLAAAARALGIPTRLGFANVRNHLATEKFVQMLQTDVFVFHGYVSLWIKGKWVKATPAFNRSLCDKFKVNPLEFDGMNDSIFHEYDTQGNKYMEYLTEHGEFADFPFHLFVAEIKKHYGHFFEKKTIENPVTNWL